MEENLLYRLDESDIKMIEEATNILITDIDDYVEGELISIYSMLCLIEELTDHIKYLNEELKEQENRYLYPDDYDDTCDRYIDELFLDLI